MQTKSNILLSLRHVTLITILAAGLLACGGEGTIQDRDSNDLQVSPTNTLSFPQTAIGETAIQEVVISNVSESGAPIRLRNPRIEEIDGRTSAFSVVNTWSGDHILGAQEALAVQIAYSPEDSVRYGGVFVFESNVPGREREEITINASIPTPEIFVPENVVFTRIPQGASDWRLLEISNIGYAPLEINGISLDTAEEFSLTYPTVTGSGTDLSVGPSDSDSSTPPNRISPGDNLYVRVTYTAADDQFRNDRVRIDSNDPSNPIKLVALTANSNSPCLEIGTAEVNFGLSSIGNTRPTSVTISNCSDVAETVVTGIELTNNADGVYALLTNSLPGQLPEGGNAVLGPRESATFRINYSPVEEQVDEGQLTVRSNDVANPVQRVPVIGQGSTYECPIAIARGRITGTTQWQTTAVSGIPLDVIELNGEDSYDPDGTSLNYEWTIVQRPRGSGAVISPNNTRVTPSIMLDIAGRYVIELNVFDEFGITACEPAQLELEAAPNADIHVELTWEVPSSPSNSGTDLDLHYIHPNGVFGDNNQWQIYWNRASADWGDDGTVSLDIDDRTGQEPENVNHNNPGGTVDAPRTFSVGVYYYSDLSNWGITVATIRIYLGGTLVRERSRSLTTGGVGVAGERMGDFWYTADIPWDGVSLDVVDIDEVFEGFDAVVYPD